MYYYYLGKGAFTCLSETHFVFVLCEILFYFQRHICEIKMNGSDRHFPGGNTSLHPARMGPGLK